MADVDIQSVWDTLNQWAPPELAESWDNTGLLLGDKLQPISAVMTCLTITPAVVEEAILQSANLVISHHPLPFRPLAKITTDHYYGKMLWHLATHRIGVLSLHTRYDSAVAGINQQLAQALGLENVAALTPLSREMDEGSLEFGSIGRGRWGSYSTPKNINDIALQLRQYVGAAHLKYIPAGNENVTRVAIGCGSAGEFLAEAARLNCQLLVLGETTFHTCLEAQANNVALLLIGHYASERHAMEALSRRLAEAFPSLRHWCSQQETNPVQWL